MSTAHGILKGAAFSECRTWRYALWRIWEPRLPCVAFIGLNPSTADETQDDPTIRRCENFARRELCGGMYMLNLFAFRATDPGDMMAATEPVGPENDTAIKEFSAVCERIVVCWGTYGFHAGRGDHVGRLLAGRPLECFGVTNSGQPRHPLYLKSSANLVSWSPKGNRGTQ